MVSTVSTVRTAYSVVVSVPVRGRTARLVLIGLNATPIDVARGLTASPAGTEFVASPEEASLAELGRLYVRALWLFVRAVYRSHTAFSPLCIYAYIAGEITTKRISPIHPLIGSEPISRCAACTRLNPR